MLDAGCGPGMLAVGASLLGAASVTAMDIDADVLETLQENIDEMEVTNIDIIQSDFLQSNIFR